MDRFNPALPPFTLRGRPWQIVGGNAVHEMPMHDLALCYALGIGVTRDEAAELPSLLATPLIRRSGPLRSS